MATGRRAAEAAALLPDDSEVLYETAVVYALAGDSRKALAALRTTLEQGFSRSVASKDEDLAALRQSPEYRRLVTIES